MNHQRNWPIRQGNEAHPGVFLRVTRREKKKNTHSRLWETTYAFESRDITANHNESPNKILFGGKPVAECVLRRGPGTARCTCTSLGALPEPRQLPQRA